MLNIFSIIRTKEWMNVRRLTHFINNWMTKVRINHYSRTSTWPINSSLNDLLQIRAERIGRVKLTLKKECTNGRLINGCQLRKVLNFRFSHVAEWTKNQMEHAISPKRDYFHPRILFIFLASVTHMHLICISEGRKYSQWVTRAIFHAHHIDKPFCVNWSRWGNVAVWLSICAARASTARRAFIAHNFRVFAVGLWSSFCFSTLFDYFVSLGAHLCDLLHFR